MSAGTKRAVLRRQIIQTENQSSLQRWVDFKWYNKPHCRHHRQNTAHAQRGSHTAGTRQLPKAVSRSRRKPLPTLAFGLKPQSAGERDQAITVKKEVLVSFTVPRPMIW